MADRVHGGLGPLLVLLGAALVVVGSLVSASSGAAVSGPRVVRVALERPPPVVEPPPEPDRYAIPLRIRRGSTFGELLARHDLPSHAIRAAALDLYDLARIRPDRELRLSWTDGRPEPDALEYDIDEDRTLVVARVDDGWRAHVDEVEYSRSEGTRAFTIRRSLWQDGLDAGLRPRDLARLAAVFEYELDFNTELRDGASFTLAAEVLEAPGRRARLGVIHAVRLTNGERSWTAVAHTDAEDRTSWYQPDGTSMRKPFLRSPLEFSRVTSGFNPRRYHPILKKRRPHNGTDFGAPTGTPVRAVADGRITRAGWAGGHGRFVKIDHEGPYETSYSHLSSISVATGQRVQQGQVIGRVGSSGLATGPHLHYQMWRSGRYVDAMRVDLPNQAPLAAVERPAFQAACDRWLPILDAAPPGAAPLPDTGVPAVAEGGEDTDLP